MRLAFAADLHGNLALYDALIALATSTGAHALMIGGDLAPHDPSRSRSITTQRRFLEELLYPRLRDLHQTLPALPVLIIPGNDDWAAAAEPVLAQFEREGLAIALHGRAIALQPNLWAAGYACVPPTPFSIKDYERPDAGAQRGVAFGQAYTSQSGQIEPLDPAHFWQRPSIATELADLATQSDPGRTIYICHTPPANTPLDRMRGDRHVGSPALRRFIEQHAPPLTLHGHIHEAPSLSGQFACQIGPTWSINPGRDPAQLHAITLDTDDIAGSLRHTLLHHQRGNDW
ncbi:MAG: hypothetical protein Fur005_02090 [Roseiflexaceae bacterium]